MTKEQAIEVLHELEGTIYETQQLALGMAIQSLEERKQGEWLFTKTVFDKYGCTVECPSCHKKWKTYDEIRWKKENNFCPNCGADMRGSKNE